MVAQTAGSEMKFSTSLETEYPSGLCRQLAIAFLEQLQKTGKNISPSTGQIEQEQRMGAGLQPRGARAPLLVGDFKFKIDIKTTDVAIPASIEDNVHIPFQGIPLHSKLISSRMVTEEGENGEKKALTLEHPLDSPHTVDKSNLKAMVFIRDHTKAEVLKFRAQQLRKYTERAAQLSSEESQLRNSLDPDVRRVLEGKRLLLFKEMAADAKVGDEHLFTELTQGFKLTGVMPESKQFPAPPLILFTDGACEEDGLCVTHGAVCYDPESNQALMFGDHVPACWTAKWRTEGKKQLICQAELFPVLVAKKTWSHLISGRAVLWFIDNNSSLAAVIRSYSPVLENYELLVINAKLDVDLQAMHWYTRVPSKSNLSDDPSRLQFSELEAKGFKRCSPRYDLTK
ncbi:unnamed protein product [Cladocopium goreaui]|uniref:Uncharacterized protein n=1 Tax=Cladocopium goreaui TaxID=2562237 RepID=A0A9P1FW46_9DINO|nr:unnamed protein product [Cladocopium goreaui]